MNPQYLPATARDDVPAWQQTVVAFLAEKERRSGSRRTVEGYARMLWPFLNRVGSPDFVTPAHVLAWAHGTGASGREPSSATVGARIARLSSYFRFLIRMGIATGNPCDALERPRTVQSVARGFSADEVRRLLAVIPDTVAGRRDRALLLMFVLTGRRRGGRELPLPAYEALCATLGDAGLTVQDMEKDAIGAILAQIGCVDDATIAEVVRLHGAYQPRADELTLARISRARDEAGRQLTKTRDVAAWQTTMGRLDAEERIAREPVESRRLTAPEIVDYTRSLPRLWADSGPDGRQALVAAIFSRLDVLGFERLEYELTPDAIDLGLDAALPPILGLASQIGEFGRGERD